LGSSGGLLVLWNSVVFSGHVIESKPYAITVDFTRAHDQIVWCFSTVYGPCNEPLRSEFVQWIRDLDIHATHHWLFAGDFNFYCSLEDRNWPGGNLNDTLIFNDIIGHLGLIELPLKGIAFMWSNMQQSPLLEQLDWFFTSVHWTTSFPDTLVLPLARTTSDHIPCKISVGTSIPRSTIFRFEIFWPEHSGFLRWSKQLGQNQFRGLTQLLSYLQSSKVYVMILSIGVIGSQI